MIVRNVITLIDRKRVRQAESEKEMYINRQIDRGIDEGNSGIKILQKKDIPQKEKADLEFQWLFPYFLTLTRHNFGLSNC